MNPPIVACPTCDAAPGERCRSGVQPGRRRGWSPGGRPVGYLHEARSHNNLAATGPGGELVEEGSIQAPPHRDLTDTGRV